MKDIVTCQILRSGTERNTSGGQLSYPMRCEEDGDNGYILGLEYLKTDFRPFPDRFQCYAAVDYHTELAMLLGTRDLGNTH